MLTTIRQFGIPMASVLAFLGFWWKWYRHRKYGSRRSVDNWRKKLHWYGNRKLYLFMGKFVRDDSIGTEGASGSTYGEVFQTVVYQRHGDKMLAYIRTSVQTHLAWDTWPTVTGRGHTAMERLTTEPRHCATLKKRRSPGGDYWVIRPQPDVRAPKWDRDLEADAAVNGAIIESTG